MNSLILRPLTFFIKDNIWFNSNFIPTTSSSLFLSNFFPIDNSTVLKLLNCHNNFLYLGKAFLDELSCGGSGLLSSFSEASNPYDENRITGGSSSQSSFLVAKDLCDFSIATDTGGSIVCPSAYCGIIGFKPSYGRISRFGLIPFASSLDTVGIISKKICIIKKVFYIISGEDANDLTTFLPKKLSKRKKNNFIAVIKGIENFLIPELKEKYVFVLNSIKKLGFCAKEVEIPEEIKNSLQLIYIIISSTELYSHLNSFKGITFGIKHHNDFDFSVKEKRSRFLGSEVKKRLLLGAFFLDNEVYLSKAKRIRFLISNWLTKIFQFNYCLIFPTLSNVAPLKKEINNDFLGSEFNFWYNGLYLLNNFSGCPSINMPVFLNIKKNLNLPSGISISFPLYEDNELLDFASILEKNVFFFKQ